ncbi:hypothetical protein FRC10_007278 [Ceratobasidium sp. 414]|nr:hypothetical protein FRC10_007278 [Ceratobasidium sp. 414]
MPSFAGFYATPEQCVTWLKEYAPEIIEKNPKASTGAVVRKAEEFMKRKHIRGLFFVEAVPLPLEGKGDPDNAPDVVMLCRRSSARKEYFAPDPVREVPLRELVETVFGLKVSEWAVIWYSGEDPHMAAEFVFPAISEGP